MPHKIFISTLVLALVSHLLPAQIAKDSTTQFDPNNPTHLIVEYEEASQALLDIKNQLRTGFDIEPIKLAYNNLQSRLDIYQRIGEINLNDASLSRMSDLISIFQRQLSIIEGWQTTLVETTKQLSNFKIELYTHKERLTLEQSDFSEIQQQYYQARHIPLLNQADSLNELVEEQLEDVLELEYKISQDHARLYNSIQVLKASVAQYWDNLMQAETVEWQISEQDLMKHAGNTMSNTSWRILDFYKVNIDRSLLLFLILAGTYFLLTKLRQIDQKKPETQQEPSLYEYPVASSLLLAGMLFSVIFPPTTSLMYDFALLASYVPFLFILKYRLPQSFRSYLIFFFFLLMLKVNGIFTGTSGYSALLNILCGVAFLYTIYSHALRKHFKIRWKWVKAINWLLITIIMVGILSTLLQRVRLGAILINGTGETIALGFILFYFANWSDHFINYLKQAPRFRNLAKNRARLNQFWQTWSNRVYLVLLVIFLVAFLKNFNLYTSVKDTVLLFFNTERNLGELAFTYGGIALFLLVIYIATKTSSTIKFLAEEKSYYKSQKETANLAVIIRFFLITVGFILALLVSGIPVDRITIILGALSVGIGFGLQNIVNNLISGIILIFERPIQTGDLVELQQYTGFVKDIGIRSSVIRTYDGAEIIVPNGHLVSQEVINWTLSNRERRVEMRVGVAYGSDVKQVIEVITNVLKAHDKVESYPEPAVLLDGFGDSSVDFRCLIWTTDIDHWLRIKSELSTNIYDALNESNITIPFPQRDLHVVSWEAGDSSSQSNSTPKAPAVDEPQDEPNQHPQPDDESSGKPAEKD